MQVFQLSALFLFVFNDTSSFDIDTLFEYHIVYDSDYILRVHVRKSKLQTRQENKKLNNGHILINDSIIVDVKCVPNEETKRMMIQIAVFL